ncbi:MAG: cupin domain-containing protein [Nitrospira sp.]|nr:cupin domain-containing protein [Nitrospira sp.]
MTETQLPEELEEQAILYALGILDQEDRQVFLVRLQGESDLLRKTVRAYQMTTGALAESVAPVKPPTILRERLVEGVALEAARETEQFESTANTLALSSVPIQPPDSLRERLLSRIQDHSDVQLAQGESARLRVDTSVQNISAPVRETTTLSHIEGAHLNWFRSQWTAVSRFLRTVLIRAVVPRPSSDGLTFVKASEGTWRGIAPGVMAKLLSFDPVSRRTTTVLRFAPGTRYAPHRHTAVEELYVLEGGCSIAGRAMSVGDYHRAESGTIHHDTSTDDGCMLLVISSPQNEMLP